ncbi:MAG: hypothetical protein PQJ60_14305, partial [Spirochaetales bacterium]|nr:hypothetical protein [Spirochaetales bacterium]
PIEELIKNNQKDYYESLSKSDDEGKSTLFIEFMLDVINKSLRNTIKESKPQNPDYSRRVETALKELDDWFDRKEYMEVCKGISTATASRDLKQLLEEKRIEVRGKGRMTQYRRTNA